MATIFTVHGTFASGEDEGNQWWQIGSDFEKDLVRFLKAPDGKLRIEPFRWDGKNSERSRRTAGRKLYRRFSELENISEPYCILGHSHGGSVIAHSLLDASKKDSVSVSHLSNWMTVGTPFIVTKRHKLSFSRLGSLGRYVYMLFLYFLILAILQSLIYLGLVEKILVIPTHSMLSSIVMILLFYVALFYVSNRGIRDEKAIRNRWSLQSNSHNWISFLHPDDEAVNGLNLAEKINFEPIPSNFAIKAITALSFLLVPAIIALITIYPQLAGAVTNHRELFPFPAEQQSFISKFWGVGMSFVTIPGYLVFEYFIDQLSFIVDIGLYEIFVISTSLVIIFLILLVPYYLFLAFSVFISFTLSKLANGTTNKQVKLSVFGSDLTSESATRIDTHPIWHSEKSKYLPAELVREISVFSDQAVSMSISKVRKALSHAMISDNPVDIVASLSADLEGNELIHTSYFSVPNFRKLLVYSIAQGDGFSASDTFKNDPDYRKIASWYEEIN